MNHVKNIMEILMFFAIATLFIIRVLDIMQKFLFLCVCSVMLCFHYMKSMALGEN